MEYFKSSSANNILIIFSVLYSVKPDASGVLRDDNRNPGSLAHFALHHFSTPMGLHNHINKTQTQADAWLHHIRVSIAAIELRPNSLLFIGRDADTII